MNGLVNYDDLDFSNTHLYLFKGVRYSGVARESEENGIIRSEMEFLSGKQHGFSRSFFRDGKMEHESYYQHGLRHGTEKRWDPAGKLKFQAEFQFDILMLSREWSETGDLIREFIRTEDDHLYKLVLERKRANG